MSLLGGGFGSVFKVPEFVERERQEALLRKYDRPKRRLTKKIVIGECKKTDK